MNLFQQIPDNLFSPLTGRLKEVYTDLLFLIYDQHKKTIYTLDREAIINLFVEYVEDKNYKIDELTEQVHDNNISELEQLSKDARERAHYFLRRLLECGWIIQEQNYDYSYRISLPDYAFLLLESLDKIKSGYSMEFQGRVLSVYQNLTGDDGSTYVAVNQARETTEELINGLKSLNHSIKMYTERLLKTQQPKEIIQQILVDYYEEILGEQYYRLKTSDHISKYRAGILKQVKNLRHNRNEIISQAETMVKERQASNRIDAENMLYNWLEFIEENFQGMDEILNEIDNRNRRYVTSAMEKLQFQMTEGAGSEEQLKRVLRYLASQAKEEGEKQDLPSEIEQLLHLYPQRVVDDQSMKKPTRTSKEHDPAPVQVQKVDRRARDRSFARFKKRVEEEITIKDINQYVREYLGQKGSLYLHEFPRKSKQDWIKLIYILLYQNSQKAEYQITGARGDMIELDEGQVELPHQVVQLKNRSASKGASK
ncbi:conserved hypothetical protein [Natranaerobius thermophilus JW/NM-WN-LF]|uniref:TIGR02677 family protein n=1 Tax=Natranaerobius thermophilus (strain ATCC BAA-1301 / DSM 18059 / JW/NM-WN-LF) TaxID=457570 RepID=B2A7Q8_NATTJ|nr:conserved hypothetical protein [Natranaerobius thermophilus JW/NM-WN-LF]